MAAVKQKFSREAAQRLRLEFENAVVPIEDALEEVQQEVSTLRTWWEGDSADMFIKVTNEAKGKVRETIRIWLDANSRLVEQIESNIFAGESSLASRMSLK